MWEAAVAAEIKKRVYPHLLRHTIAQYLGRVDRGTPENLLQEFQGMPVQEPHKSTMNLHVKRAFEEAMRKDPLI